MVDLASGWRLERAPLDADLSDPSLDLSSWTEVELTDPWAEHVAPGQDGAIWYRRAVTLPPGSGPAPALLLGPSHHGGYQLWADGLPAGRVGSASNLLPFPQPRLIPLPPAAAADGRVELAIRFRRVGWISDAAGESAGPFMGVALLGPRAEMERRLELDRLRSRMSDVLPLLFGILFAGIGAYHLLLHWRRPSDRGYLWFGLGAAAFGANTILLTSWVTAPVDRLSLTYRATEIAGHGALVALILFLWTVLDRPVGRWLRLYLGSHGLMVLFLLLAPFRWIWMTAPARVSWMIPALVFAPAVLVSALRAGHPRAAPLLVGVVFLVAAEVGELARMFGAPLPGWLPWVGFSAVLLSMALALAERFSRAHAELRVLRRDLEHRIEQRTAAMIETARAAERSQRAQGEFLAGMSHELRAPLNSIIGFSGVLLRRGEHIGPRERDFLERIRASGEQLLRVLEDVFELSRIDAGKVDVRIEDTDLGEVVKAAAATSARSAEAKPIYLEVRIPPRLRPTRVDRERLTQLLRGLIAHAVAYTEHGGVSVRVEAEGDRPRAVLVEDTGPDVPGERLAHLFDPFHDGKVDPDRPRSATGLELVISRALCRLTGCELTVESQPGSGTRFRVSLPPVPAHPTIAQPTPAAPAAPAEEHGGEGALVLVIDDEPDARLLLEEHVRSFGLRVMSAASGPEGLRLARELAPDLVTLDLRMPGMDGWATLRAFKADPGLRTIPVVVVSVVAEEASAFLGRIDLVGKPVDRDALEQAVRRNLGGGASRALVVDDDPDARLLLTALLESAVEEVRTAEDGAHALEVLEDFDPSVILLDLVMPRMDGMGFLQILRNDPRHARTPVLVVTSKELSVAETAVLERATAGVLSKGDTGSPAASLRDRLSTFLEGTAVRN